jgi:hypothetical protein
MKTKELIRRLQAEDPSGEEEVTVMGCDIYFLSTEPGYYDGCYQRLRHDPAKAPYYDIVGADYIGSGLKVVIHTYSISDLLLDNPEAPVGFIDVSHPEWYEQSVEKRRNEVRQMHQDLESGHFAEYIVRRMGIEWNENCDEDLVKAEARKWADENLRHDDPMPKDILKRQELEENPNGSFSMHNLSWNQRRERQWDREITIGFNAEGLTFHRQPTPAEECE